MHMGRQAAARQGELSPGMGTKIGSRFEPPRPAGQTVRDPQAEVRVHAAMVDHPHRFDGPDDLDDLPSGKTKPTGEGTTDPSRLNEIRAKIEAGYYSSPEVLASLADRLTDHLRGTK